MLYAITLNFIFRHAHIPPRQKIFYATRCLYP